MSKTLLFIILALSSNLLAAETTLNPYKHSDATGWAFYDPKEVMKDEEEPVANNPVIAEPEEAIKKPVMPDVDVLYNMHPTQHKELEQEFLGWAVKTQEKQDVENYYRVLDVIRKKASGFAAVTQLVMNSTPSLNVNKLYPSTRLGSERLYAVREEEANKFLSDNVNKYGLLYFISETCKFCAEQDAILANLVEEHNINVEVVDIDKNLLLATRMGVKFTPTIAVVDRITAEKMIISSGVESQPKIKEAIISSLKLLRGTIKPNQYFTKDFQRDGSFDPAYVLPFGE